MFKKYEYKGETLSVLQLAKKYGISESTLRNRLKTLSIADAIERENGNYNYVEVNGVRYKSYNELCKTLHISLTTIRQKLKEGYTLDEIINKKIPKQVKINLLDGFPAGFNRIYAIGLQMTRNKKMDCLLQDLYKKGMFISDVYGNDIIVISRKSKGVYGSQFLKISEYLNDKQIKFIEKHNKERYKDFLEETIDNRKKLLIK